MVPKQDLISLSHSTRNRLIVTCAGLLEVTDQRREDKSSSFGDDDSEDHSENVLSEDDNCDNNRENDNHEHRMSTVSTNGGEAAKEELQDLGYNRPVTFIHRTAYNFMRNATQGGRFLKDSTAENLDLKVLIIKATLVKMRLCGFKRFPPYYTFSKRFKYFYNNNRDLVMRLVLEVEARRAVSQRGLCDLINYTYSRNDRLYLNERVPDVRQGSHWCDRWSPLSNLLYKGRDSRDSEIWLKEVFRSSSLKFTNLSELAAEARPSPDCILPKEFNFLELTVFYGLSYYVQDTLNQFNPAMVSEMMKTCCHMPQWGLTHIHSVRISDFLRGCCCVFILQSYF